MGPICWYIDFSMIIGIKQDFSFPDQKNLRSDLSSEQFNGQIMEENLIGDETWIYQNQFEIKNSCSWIFKIRQVQKFISIIY